jgi:hypothetical protein
MTSKANNLDIVALYRPARERLRLGTYERYLAERLARRVAQLQGKRDGGDQEEVDAGDVLVAGEGAAPHDSARARVHANNPPV